MSRLSAKSIALWSGFSLSTFGVALALLLAGGIWLFVFVAWCVMLFVSGFAFPVIWKRFWITSMKILNAFGIL